MSKLLLQNALIIPLDDDSEDYYRGDILIRGGVIERIIPRPLAGGAEDVKNIIDCTNMAVMPGFVNTHGHASMSLMRGYADDMPLQSWLEDKIWPLEEYLQSDDIYWGAQLSIAEMIKGGTTTFTDMYFEMDRVAEAAAESGIRAVLARGLIGLDSGGEEALKDTARFIDDWHGEAGGRINISLGPHAPYTCPPEFLKKVIALAEKSGRLVQIHLSETAFEVQECLKQYGVRPPQLLNEAGLLELPVIAAHCVHLDPDDISILAEKRVGVAHNPGSNLKLGSGVAPLCSMLEAGIKVGLGTDGPASNNNLDMVEEMRLASLLAKGIAQDPTLVPAKKALQLATRGGAEALGLTGIGQLREGYRADLIGFKLDVPHLIPLHDPLAHLAYAASAADVDLVIVDGAILLEKGKLVRVDEDKIRAEATRCAFTLIERSKK